MKCSKYQTAVPGVELDEALKNNVAQFLKQFKDLAQNELFVVPREKNTQALLQLGLTFADRRNEILSLSVEEYFRGPVPDHDQSGDVWEFGKMIAGVEIYIKLKLVEYQPKGQTETVRKAKCLSFHVAEKTLIYPFK